MPMPRQRCAVCFVETQGLLQLLWHERPTREFTGGTPVPHAEAGETPALPWRGDAGGTVRSGVTH